MNASAQRVLISLSVSVVVCICGVAATFAFAQTRQSSAGRNVATQGQPGGQAAMDAERAQIWNSPNMLRARAWLQDHISKSAKITPEEGRKYMTELENLTPAQMKLWLLKFDHEEQQRQQQYAFWQQSQQVLAGQALAAHRATQQAYANINREETEAAEQEQGQLNEQAAARQERSMDKQFVPFGPYGPYGYGFQPGYGGIHFHYHLYPNAN
ncbi:MAG: hypothetical protein L0228_16235 [Planctomycetes bacterium]|nr:hypothetical protein [Planctomycetota bacterium]